LTSMTLGGSRWCRNVQSCSNQPNTQESSCCGTGCGQALRSEAVSRNLKRQLRRWAAAGLSAAGAAHLCDGGRAAPLPGKQVCVLAHALARQRLRRHHAGDDHRRDALDVVAEDWEVAAVPAHNDCRGVADTGKLDLI